MKLSIVVIFHDMVREAARTLHSLSAAYQRGLISEDYEVIAIDNGSSRPLVGAEVRRHGPQFAYHFHRTGSVSPAEAVNVGAEMAAGDLLAVIVDGARMASPGLIGQTQRAAKLHDLPFICALSWHLGPDIQNRSMLAGYNRAEEDRLLGSIEWPEDGYALFSVATLAPSSEPGFLRGVPPECSWLALPRHAFEALGGFERRFESLGGGLVNHDFRDRALARPGVSPVVLLGEGVFHQFHGGVATNVAAEDHPFARFAAEYEHIRGAPWRPSPGPAPEYYGALPDAARRFVKVARE